MLRVTVHSDNFERALRKFRKQVQASGLLLEVRARQEYEKPSVKRNRAKAAAKMRWKKYMRDQQLLSKDF